MIIDNLSVLTIIVGTSVRQNSYSQGGRVVGGGREPRFSKFLGERNSFSRISHAFSSNLKKCKNREIK